MAAGRARSERLFAALSAPVLSLSAEILYMFKPHAAELLLPSCWRAAHRLSTADVVAALLAAHVCEPPSLDPVTCPQCGPLLELGASVASDCTNLPSGVESYRVAVRSRCTSSRRHLRRPTVVLTVDLAPGIAVCSEPFSVFARRPGRQAKIKESNLAAAPRAPTMALARPVGAPCIRVVVCVFVPVASNVCSQHSLALSRVMVDGMVSTLRTRVPGFIRLLCNLSCPVSVFVVAFQSLEDALQGMVVLRQYTKNEIPNPLSMDIEGTAVPLAVVTNW